MKQLFEYKLINKPTLKIILKNLEIVNFSQNMVFYNKITTYFSIFVYNYLLKIILHHNLYHFPIILKLKVFLIKLISYKGKTQKEVAAIIGKSQMTVSRLEKKVMEKLRSDK